MTKQKYASMTDEEREEYKRAAREYYRTHKAYRDSCIRNAYNWSVNNRQKSNMQKSKSRSKLGLIDSPAIKEQKKHLPNKCEICGGTKFLQITYKDFDKTNTSIENLMTICSTCNGKRHWID